MATIDVRVAEDELRRNLAAITIPTPAQQDRLEVRLLTIYITLSFLNDLTGPIAYVFGIAPSMLSRVANMAPYHGVGIAFVLALILMIPHTISLLLFPATLRKRWPRKMAVMACVLSCLTWMYLAVLAQPIDVSGGPLSVLYARQGLESLFLAFLFAISLNAQQLRWLHDHYFKGPTK